MEPNLALRSTIQANFSHRPFCVRRAMATDIPALIDFKLQISAVHGTAALVDASEDAWVQDGFGSAFKFGAFVAEQAGVVVGMIIFNEQQFAGWSRPSYVQEVFVEPGYRQLGIGESLLANVAAYANERDAPLLYLNV
jgi:ribosomal protein S18 acetylase RimI-like enzyme